MGVFRVVVQVAEKMAKEERCPTVVKMIKLGEDDHVVEARWGVCEASSLMTVARTMDQQLGKAEETATSPHQYAVSTMAGCECIAHILQGAFDLNPRGAMMLHLLGICGTFLRAQRTLSHREKEASTGTPPCHSCLHWVSKQDWRRQNDQLSAWDHSLAFLGDTYIVTQPEMWNRARIRIHGVEVKIWSRAGCSTSDLQCA